VKANRNDACPCGSGKKFKKCCEGKSTLARTSFAKRSGILGAVSILVAAGAVAAWLNRGDAPEQTPEVQAVAAAPVAAPAAGGSATTPPQTTSAIPGAQPPGPAPIGKVWSAEHGHWHDSPLTPNRRNSNAPNPIQITTSTAPLTEGSSVSPPIAFSQPPTAAQPGKVWSVAHGHWHDAPAGAMANAIPQPARNVPQPPGRVPAGKVWSPEHGHWHDKP
jgi:hypothetical protein